MAYFDKSNTLLKRFPIMLSVYIVYRMHTVMRSMVVVYFDQQTGALHAVRWLKSIFSVVPDYIMANDHG